MFDYDLNEIKEEATLNICEGTQVIILSKRKIQCKGPEVGLCLAQTGKEASELGGE